jgi:FkbM family methyltransferase
MSPEQSLIEKYILTPQGLKEIVKSRVPEPLWNKAKKVYGVVKRGEPVNYPGLITKKLDGITVDFGFKNPTEYYQVRTFGKEKDYIEQVLFPLLKPGVTFVDVGACVGTHAVSAAKKQPRAGVYAIEPDPDCFQSLTENACRNELSNITLLNIALGCTDSVLLLQTSGSAGMAPRINGIRSVNENINKFDRTIPVKCERLDDLVARGVIPHPHVAKIDAEGFELPILEGFGETVRPNDILIEVHPSMGVPYGTANFRLEAMGYCEVADHRIKRDNEFLCHYERVY